MCTRLAPFQVFSWNIEKLGEPMDEALGSYKACFLAFCMMNYHYNNSSMNSYHRTVKHTSILRVHVKSQSSADLMLGSLVFTTGIR